MTMKRKLKKLRRMRMPSRDDSNALQRAAAVFRELE